MGKRACDSSSHTDVCGSQRNAAVGDSHCRQGTISRQHVHVDSHPKGQHRLVGEQLLQSPLHKGTSQLL